MASDYDAQLLESVAVRRRRLLGALLRGTLHTRRGFDDNLKRGAVSALIAAVLCAGCVGWSFLRHQLASQSPITTPTAPGVPRR
jgi:hypothetical protein